MRRSESEEKPPKPAAIEEVRESSGQVTVAACRATKSYLLSGRGSECCRGSESRYGLGQPTINPSQPVTPKEVAASLCYLCLRPSY